MASRPPSGEELKAHFEEQLARNIQEIAFLQGEVQWLREALQAEKKKFGKLETEYAKVLQENKDFRAQLAEEVRRRRITIRVPVYLDPVSGSSGAIEGVKLLMSFMNDWARSYYFVFDLVEEISPNTAIALYVVCTPTGRLEENYSPSKFSEIASKCQKALLTVARWGTNPSAFYNTPSPPVDCEIIYNGTSLLQCTPTAATLKLLSAALMQLREAQQ